MTDMRFYQMHIQQPNGNWKLDKVWECSPRDFSAMCAEKVREFDPVQIRFVKYQLSEPEKYSTFAVLRGPKK